MLKSIKLHNFKTFLNAEFRFSKRHLILGKNNSGKTNLATALWFLSGAGLFEELDRAVSIVPGGLEDLCNRQLRSNQIELACRCEIEFAGEPCEYEYELHLVLNGASRVGPTGRAEISVSKERLTFRTENLPELVLLENDGRESTLTHEGQAIGGSNPHRPTTLSPHNATMLSKLYELDTNRRAVHFRNYLRKWWYFSFSPMAMRRGAMVTPPQTSGGFLDPHGERLAYAIFHLKNFDEQRYRRLIEHVQPIEPSLEAINFVPVPNQTPVPFVHLSDAPRTGWLGLSDGTLRGLALSYCIELAAANSPPEQDSAPLLLIEEPENGIFPGQLRRIYDLFEEWAPTSQFIFTSHSPYFIDMFNDKRDCVTILRKAADRTEIAPPIPVDNSEDENEQLTLSMQYSSELYE